MKTMLGSRRRHYVAGFSIFLVMAALIVGMVGCSSTTSSPSSYTLTIASGGGGTVTSPGVGSFTETAGAVVNLVATPANNYAFVGWTGNVSSISNVDAATTTITMNGNYVITADFIARYDLTTSSSTGGSVTTPGEGTFTYDQGTVVDLVATPASGHTFVSWTGNVGAIAYVNAASTTITMNSDYSITANFEAIQCSFSYSGHFSGSITAGVFDITSGTVEIGPSTYTVINAPPVGYNSSSAYNQFSTTSAPDQLTCGAISLTNDFVMGLAAVYNQTSPTELSVTFGVWPSFPGSTAVTLDFDGNVIASINATGYLQTSGSAFTLSASGTAW
jgi:hypothetical protein